jgi:hypothetical protein
MSVRAAYFTLLGLVYDELPKEAVTITLSKNKKLTAKPAKLQNVRRGASADLKLLLVIVKACLPKFEIPESVTNSLKAN